jgi:L-seryl-tRNA(Ser) seleniumtransferase
VATTSNSALLQRLPSIDEVLRQADMRALVERDSFTAVVASTRAVLDRLRREIAAVKIDEKGLDLALGGLLAAIEEDLRRSLEYSLRPLINATGVILHTNLGRAPLASSALDHIVNTAAGYSNLEFELGTGARGKRDVHVERLMQELLTRETLRVSAPRGIEDPLAPVPRTISTIIVNNNAAAVLLALNSLAEGGEVIVSRGELVEIGGSFRIPDVMSKSQATLREVGTTNRTRIPDYERAISERTRLLLRVHRSNFEISGFTEQPSLDELVGLARHKNIPLVEDLGSGALFDQRSVGITGEPGVVDSLRAGVDVVTYSGDKLLGGPQAGLISGRADLVARMRSNSLFRALRVDKLTYAALEGTLLAYIKRDHDSIPVLRMMRLPKGEIAHRAEALVATVQASKLRLELLDGESLIGGGAAPSSVLPSCLIGLTHSEISADELSSRLRANHPPIIARVEEGRVLLDLRTVFAQQDATVAAALVSLN